MNPESPPTDFETPAPAYSPQRSVGSPQDSAPGGPAPGSGTARALQRAQRDESVDVTVAIVTWNGLRVLEPCLRSLFSTQQSVTFEVIVVDNASSDGTVEFVRSSFPSVRIIENAENRGFAAANNQAFAIAQGRNVLLLNNDTLVFDESIAQVSRYLDATPSAGAVGCRVEFPDGSFQTSCYRFTGLRQLALCAVLPFGSIFDERLNWGRYFAKQFERPTPVDVIAGCYLMTRRAVLESIGGLNETFFMYGEDEEWCWRLRQAGFQAVYFPAARIIHIHRFSSTAGKGRVPRQAEALFPVLLLAMRGRPASAWLANLLLLIGRLLRFPVVALRSLVGRQAGQRPSKAALAAARVIRFHLVEAVKPSWRKRDHDQHGTAAESSVEVRR